MKGQAFTVFKMLIGAAFAAALLVIVYGSIHGIGCSSYAVDNMLTLTKQAVNMPGSCFENQICFDKGTVFKQDFFVSSLNLNSMSISSDVKHVCQSGNCNFGFKANLPVSVSCSSGLDCQLSIGRHCAP